MSFATVDKIDFSPYDLKLPTRYTGLSPLDKKVIRERYIELQKSRCFHCHGYLNEYPPDEILGLEINKNLFPKGFFDHPIHLHHDHGTDLTIGVTHAICNAVLWQYEGE